MRSRTRTLWPALLILLEASLTVNFAFVMHDVFHQTYEQIFGLVIAMLLLSPLLWLISKAASQPTSPGHRQKVAEKDASGG